MKEKRVGRTREEAREKCLEALKERLWEEVWRDELELEVKSEEVVEVAGMYEVEIEV